MKTQPPARSLATLVPNYETTRRHTPEDRNLQPFSHSPNYSIDSSNYRISGASAHYSCMSNHKFYVKLLLPNQHLIKSVIRITYTVTDVVWFRTAAGGERKPRGLLLLQLRYRQFTEK
jgi:hypothetical protein